MNNISKKISILWIVALILLVASPSSVKAASKAKAYKAYKKWIKENEKYTDFVLIKIDNDNIPELIAKYEERDFWFPYVCAIIAYKSGKCCTQIIPLPATWEIYYIPGKSKLHVFGFIDYYKSDEIYKLSRKGFSVVAEGKQTDISLEDDRIDRLYTESLWNSSYVSLEQYNELLCEAFNPNKQKKLSEIRFKTRPKMLKKLG